MIAGIPPGDRSSFPASVARERGLTILLSRRMKAHHMHRAIELVERGAVSLDGLITARYPIAQGPEAFATLLRRSELKIVVKPSG